jgi:ketosteroid isomerase-like protein
MSLIKRLFPVAVVLLASFAAAGTPTDPEREVLAAIRARLDAVARNDIKAWGEHVADDMLAPLGGEKPDKAVWMASHAAWPPQVSYWYGDFQNARVRIHGDTAVVTYRARQFTRVGDQTTHADRWQIETLHRDQPRGRWLLIGVADAALPPEPAPLTLDAATLDAYVGEYQWAPGLTTRITRDGTKLFEDFAGAGPAELGAESRDVFFFPGAAASGDSSRIVFVRDGAGRVTHYLYREYGATDRRVPRLR